MIDQIKIGGFLRELRKEKELTQEQLAEKFGVSSRSVSRWENGNTMPELGILVELADYYEVDIKEIIDGERKSEIMEKEEHRVYFLPQKKLRLPVSTSWARMVQPSTSSVPVTCTLLTRMVTTKSMRKTV